MIRSNYPKHEIDPATLDLAMIREQYLPSLSLRTLRRWISSERFPASDIAVGARVRLWFRSTITGWLRDQQQASDTGITKRRKH